MDKVKILIVEDEFDTLDAMRTMLQEDLECEVDQADNGKVATSKIKENDYDLVILDIKMPVMSGMDMIRAVKVEKSLPDTLVVSGYDSVEAVNEVLEEGVIDYIVKPIEWGDLMEKISYILNKKGRLFRKNLS